jgi:hypothetical protein
MASIEERSADRVDPRRTECAGKTTVSSVFVGPDVKFVNADIIGAELRRDDPRRPGADMTAGRIVSARLRALTAERRSFCFETNLASPGLVGRIDVCRSDGYEAQLVDAAAVEPDVLARHLGVAALDVGGGCSQTRRASCKRSRSRDSARREVRFPPARSIPTNLLVAVE